MYELTSYVVDQTSEGGPDALSVSANFEAEQCR